MDKLWNSSLIGKSLSYAIFSMAHDLETLVDDRYDLQDFGGAPNAPQKFATTVRTPMQAPPKSATAGMHWFSWRGEFELRRLVFRCSRSYLTTSFADKPETSIQARENARKR